MGVPHLFCCMTLEMAGQIRADDSVQAKTWLSYRVFNDLIVYELISIHPCSAAHWVLCCNGSRINKVVHKRLFLATSSSSSWGTQARLIIRCVLGLPLDRLPLGPGTPPQGDILIRCHRHKEAEVLHRGPSGCQSSE